MDKIGGGLLTVKVCLHRVQSICFNSGVTSIRAQQWRVSGMRPTRLRGFSLQSGCGSLARWGRERTRAGWRDFGSVHFYGLLWCHVQRGWCLDLHGGDGYERGQVLRARLQEWSLGASSELADELSGPSFESVFGFNMFFNLRTRLLGFWVVEEGLRYCWDTQSFGWVGWVIVWCIRMCF